MSNTHRKMVVEEVEHSMDQLIRALRSMARDAENEAARIEKAGVAGVHVDGHMASNLLSRIMPPITHLAMAIGKRDALDLAPLFPADGANSGANTRDGK
jgi:hypothetical protein